jgi:hypothetical protein
MKNKTQTQFSELARDIQANIAANRKIKSQLKKLGPVVVEAAKGDGTLRDLARRSNLSSTYLSLVACRRQSISPATFCRLINMIG